MKIRIAVLCMVLLCSNTYGQQPPHRPYKSVFGWDGDKDAAIAYEDGSYFVRDGLNRLISFGISKNLDTLKWYNEEGYLPCLVTEFSKDHMHVKIMNFGDKVTVDSQDYVVGYSRVIVQNLDSQPLLPPLEQSPELVPLNPLVKIPAATTKAFDFAIMLDRFGKESPRLSNQDIVALGGWDHHFSHMKNYWNKRLSHIAILETPRKDVNDSYKATFVYTHIVKDGLDLTTGEEEYDHVYDHDANGILWNLFTMGDFVDAKELLERLPSSVQYEDGGWLYTRPWALYLTKTRDANFVAKHYEKLKAIAHGIAADRTGPGRVMKMSNDIDAKGFWLGDNWTGLMGLESFEYVSQALGKLDEAGWARKEYEDLLDSTVKQVTQTMEKLHLEYLPVSVFESNWSNRTRIANDANWASALGGMWDDWIMGGHIIDTVTPKRVEDTYDYGFMRLYQMGMAPYNFGGFPDYSSTYNTGYASVGLLTEKHRDLVARSYEFMLENSQSGPYSWWEGIQFPGDSPWEGRHPKGGDGDCPHIWGQSTNSRIVLESIVAQRFNGELVIGLGVPDDWLDRGSVSVHNFPVTQKHRAQIKIEKLSPNVYRATIKGAPLGKIKFDLPVFVGKKIKTDLKENLTQKSVEVTTTLN